MGLWRVPEKVVLPAEPDHAPGIFELNGRLPNGDQVMAYVGSRSGDTYPSAAPFTTYTAVLFRFDSDGALRSCEFASTTQYGGDSNDQNPERGYNAARELLSGLAQGAREEGWVSSDILVRPFYVMVDGLETGLIYSTDGEDTGEETDYESEELRLVPFDVIFHRPWTTGEYDT